jgi:hypothetical protein
VNKPILGQSNLIGSTIDQRVNRSGEGDDGRTTIELVESNSF